MIILRIFVLLLLCANLYSSFVLASTDRPQSPYEPFINYEDIGASSGVRMKLLDLNETLARMQAARNFYKGYNQIKWQNEFIDRDVFEQELEKTEEELFKTQLVELGINKEEHNGKPSNFEVLAIIKEITLLKQLLFELEELIRQRDQLYQETTNEVQHTMQKKLQLRGASASIPQDIRSIESRLHILKIKIDRLTAWAYGDPTLLMTYELTKVSYNEVVLAVAIEKADHKLSKNPSGFFKFFIKPEIAFAAPILPKALDLLYLEFDLNDSSYRNLNAKDRLLEFEEKLKELQGPRYETVEMRFIPQNGYQEAAYYYARVRKAPIMRGLHNIHNRDDLREFQEITLDYQTKEIELPAYFKRTHLIGSAHAQCAKYFIK